MYLEIKEGAFNNWNPTTINQLQWEQLEEGLD